ncbi:MAG: GIY-YIG nuclease family protein [Thermomicrobiales bacterium]
MSRGVTVKIFLADGKPEGLKIVEKSNWSGIGYMSSRAQLPEALKRSHFAGPGIYVLIGQSEHGSQDSIYIGEADVVATRLRQHQKAEEDWTHFVLFASKDANLNKAHVRYLESRLVEIARQAKRAQLRNTTQPAQAQISESDQADMESFLEDMLLIYPLLGLTAFEVVESRVAVKSSERLYLKGLDAEAQGRATTEGFIVLEGSRGRIDDVPSQHEYVKSLKQDLLQSGVLVERAGNIVVTQDYRFESPSTAAAVLLGRTANGRIEWKDSNGRTLRQIQSAAIESLANSETTQVFGEGELGSG